MKHEKPFLVSCILVITLSLIIPVYGEVLSFKTDRTFYGKTSTIAFSGTVEKEDYGELVTIIIDDPSGEFVHLIQVFPDDDSNFQKSVDVNKFYTDAGIYNATAFVVAKTNGMVIDFDVEKQRPATTLSELESNAEPENNVVPDTQTSQNTETDEDKKTIQEKIKERIDAAKKLKESQTIVLNETGKNITDKPDGNYTVLTSENKPTEDDLDIDENKSPTTDVITATDIMITTDIGSNLLYVAIGLGGVGAAGAIIYGIKNKSRNKTDSSSHFTSQEKNEPSQKTTMQSDDDYALMILKNRLAKGEITIDEFNELKKALKEP